MEHRMFDELLSPTKRDSLHIHFPSPSIDDRSPSSPADVHLRIHRPISFCLRMLLYNRRIAMAESFMAGEWDAPPSLKSLLQLLISSRRDKKNGRSSLLNAPWNAPWNLRRLTALWDKWTH